MVDFVLVTALVTLVFLALVQLTLLLYVRNTVADAAASGARYGVLADRTAGDAEDRTRSLIEQTLGEGYARNVQAGVESANGQAVMTVHVVAPMPVIGLFGPGRALEMSGHAALQN